MNGLRIIDALLLVGGLLALVLVVLSWFTPRVEPLLLQSLLLILVGLLAVKSGLAMTAPLFLLRSRRRGRTIRVMRDRP